MSISFSQKGKGSSVVLLHGFCETRQIWAAFANELSQKIRVLTPDLPGFGESKLPTSDLKIFDISEAIYQWLQDLGINETVVIGHSLGGYVALELAKNHPEMIKGLSLFHSTAFADNKEKKASREKAIKFVQEHGVPAFVNNFIPELFYSKNRKALKSAIEEVVNIAAQTQQESFITYTKAMRDRDDRTDVLKSLDQPILLIAGENDAAVPPEDIIAQELLPKKGIVHFLEDTGHMGMFEKKAVALKAVDNFINICWKG